MLLTHWRAHGLPTKHALKKGGLYHVTIDTFYPCKVLWCYVHCIIDAWTVAIDDNSYSLISIVILFPQKVI